MTERTRRRAPFCLRSMRNARRMGGGWTRSQRGRGFLLQDTITPRRPPGRGRYWGSKGVASYVALMPSWDLLKWAGMHPVGGLRNNMRRLAIRPRRLWRRGCPTIPTSCQSLHSEYQLEQGKGVEKAEGPGFGQHGKVAGSTTDGHDDDDSARRRFELRSDFPRIRTQPQTGPVHWVAVA